MRQGLATLTMVLAGHGLTWLIQSSALLALGLLAGRLWKRSGPAVESAVYRTALAAVLICPVASAVLAGAGFEGLTIQLRLPAASVAPAPVSNVAVAQPFSATTVAAVRDDSGKAVVMPTRSRSRAPAETQGVPTLPEMVPIEPTPVSARPRSWVLIAAATGLAVWLLGSTVLGLRLWVGQQRMCRLRASAVPAEADVEAICQELAGRLLLRAPAVLRSPFLFSPCLVGIWRPAILLPEDVVDNLRETFVHELAHLGRRDGFWNLLRRCAVAALWVQPLLWVLSRRLEATAEEVCDDHVVQFGADRARYAGHLLDLAGRALPQISPTSVGMVSLRSLLGRRIVRILDPSHVLSTTAGTRAILAMVAAGLAGTLLAGLLGVGAGKREARAQTDEKTKTVQGKPDSKDKTIRGQVVGPDGKRVAGAVVTIARTRWGVLSNSNEESSETQVLGRAVAGKDGSFALASKGMMRDTTTDPRSPAYWQCVQLTAQAPGLGVGVGWYLGDGDLTGQIDLVRDDVPINGRLVDLEGRPAAGVLVRVYQLEVFPAEELRKAEAEAEAQTAPFRFPTVGYTRVPGETAWPGSIITDADGRFRIAGLGRDRRAVLEISGEKVALQRVKVATRRIPRMEEPPAEPELKGVDQPGLYGADCTIAVEPTRPIAGVVHDADTHEPIPGAVVTVFALAGSTLMIEGVISAVTDAQGRYRLVGLPRADGHNLAVYPPLDRPYFITRALKVPAGAGFDPVKFDMALKRGVWITGKVSDIKTGKPVQASVDYFPFLSNTYAKDYRNFRPGHRSLQIKTRYRTDREGRFRVVGLPGRGVVTAHSDNLSYRVGLGAEAVGEPAPDGQLLVYELSGPGSYQRLKEVDLPEGATSSTCDLALDPGGSIRVRLVDPAGAPLTGVAANGRFPPSVDFGDPYLDDETVAQVVALDPGKPRTVVFRHDERKLGAVLNLAPGTPRDGAELTVTLRPDATLTGRLVDAQGKPASGVVQVALVLAKEESPDLNEIPITDAKLDADGRFRCDEVPPGGKYLLTAAGRLFDFPISRRKPKEFERFDLAKDLPAEPGQVIDLGTFDVTQGKHVEAPPAKAGPADVPINGRIVDLEGRPVAGVAVRVESVEGPKQGDLTSWIDAVKRGEPPWTAYRFIDDGEVKIPETARREATTDKDGRFRLEGLGAERVVTLKLLGDLIAATTIDVITRRVAPIAARGFKSSYGPGSETVHGADFTCTARPGRSVEGVVRDAGNGEPMAGVTVESYAFAGSDFVGTDTLRTTTDSRGRFRLMGLPKGRGNRVLAVPNDDQPYFQREVPVGDPPGIEPAVVEITLHRGIWITGKVTDKATGKPAQNAQFHYLPFLENPFVQALPEFDKDGNVDGSQFRYQTAADGTYKLVGMPGRAIVGVDNDGKTSYRSGVGSESIAELDDKGHFKTYRNPISPGRSWPLSMKEINPAAGTESVVLDLQLDPGLSVRLKAVDADGVPITGVEVTGCEKYGHVTTFPAAEFALVSFAPDEERNVMVRHEERKLGKVVRVRAGADANGPVVVRLEPLAMIRGRAVDPDGHAVAAATIRPDIKPWGDFGLSLRPVVSDPDGRFEVDGVPTGCDYRLSLVTGTKIKQYRYASAETTVRPGETTDVGEVRFKRN